MAEVVGIGQVTFSDLMDAVSKNLLNSNTWVEGATGSQPGFPCHGDAAESVIERGVDPYGRENLLWKCDTSGAYDAAGGWVSDPVDVNDSKPYRFIVFLKRSHETSGASYFGLYSNMSSYKVRNMDDTDNTNPYFIMAHDLPLADRWYCLVGYVHPAASTYSVYTGGGIWDMVIGQKLSTSVRSCKWLAGTTRVKHRAFYYGGAVGTYQWQWGPRIECADGTEEALENIIAAFASAYRLNEIADDELVTEQEKNIYSVEWCGIYNDMAATSTLSDTPSVDGEYKSLRDQANTVGIWTPSTSGSAAKAFKDAAEALRAYLFTSPGVLHASTYSQTIPITKADWRSLRASYRLAADGLRAAISATSVVSPTLEGLIARWDLDRIPAIPDGAPYYRNAQLWPNGTEGWAGSQGSVTSIVSQHLHVTGTTASGYAAIYTEALLVAGRLLRVRHKKATNVNGTVFVYTTGVVNLTKYSCGDYWVNEIILPSGCSGIIYFSTDAVGTAVDISDIYISNSGNQGEYATYTPDGSASLNNGKVYALMPSEWNAARFNGFDSFVELERQLVAGTGSDIVFKLKLDTSGDYILISSSSATNGLRSYIRDNAGTLNINLCNGTTTVERTVASFFLHDSAIHEYRIRLMTTALRVYRDEVEIGSHVESWTGYSIRFYYFGMYANAAYFLKGELGQILVYGREVTAAELRAYQAGSLPPALQTAADLLLERLFARVITLLTGGKIKSSNFVAGTSGFQIEDDGSAEFNDVTVRGDFTGIVETNEITLSGVTAGGNIIKSDDAEELQASGSYTKVKELQIAASGTITVDFDLKGHPDDPIEVYGRIYVNSVAVGTERWRAESTYQTFSENIAVQDGDLVQLYAKQNNSYGAYVRNFRIKCAENPGILKYLGTP